MDSINKKTTQVERVIDWGFLCSSVGYNNHGGLDAWNITTDFDRSTLKSIALVFRISFKRSMANAHIMVGKRIYSIDDEWLLQLVIKDQAGTQLYSHQSKFNYRDQTVAVTFDMLPAMEAGYYMVEILADGFLEHTLDLFVV